MTVRFALAAFVVSILVACGGSAPAPDESQQVQDQEEEAAPAPAKAPAPAATLKPQSGYAIAN